MESQFNLIAIFLLILTSITFLVLSFAKPKQKGDIANRLEKIKTNYDNEKQKVINKEKKTDILKLEFDQFSNRTKCIYKMFFPSRSNSLNVIQ